MSSSFLTPRTVAHQGSLSMGFPRKNTGVDWHFLLQGIFPTQGSNFVTFTAGWFFTTEQPGKPRCVCVCVCVCVSKKQTNKKRFNWILQRSKWLFQKHHFSKRVLQSPWQVDIFYALKAEIFSSVDSVCVNLLRMPRGLTEKKLF